jgi:hypothetical protein
MHLRDIGWKGVGLNNLTPVAGSCDHGDESSASEKDREFLDYQNFFFFLFKKNSAAGSYLVKCEFYVMCCTARYVISLVAAVISRSIRQSSS